MNRSDVPHGGLGSPFLAVFGRHVVTASREIELPAEYNRQSLQHQCVEGLPQLPELALGLDSPWRLETILASEQSVLETGFHSNTTYASNTALEVTSPIPPPIHVNLRLTLTVDPYALKIAARRTEYSVTESALSPGSKVPLRC